MRTRIWWGVVATIITLFVALMISYAQKHDRLLDKCREEVSEQC